jgi:hypothetical protein
MRLPQSCDWGVGNMNPLGEFGRRAAEIVIETGDLPEREREARTQQQISALLYPEHAL